MTSERPTAPPDPSALRSARRQALDRLADEHGGVLSRQLLGKQGVNRDHIRNAVESGRWRLLGDQSVAIHTGALTELGDQWRAVWETGIRIAAIDGASALRVGGLRGFDTDQIFVSIPHGSDPGEIEGVDLRRVVRRVPGELVAVGLPRTKPAVAAIRAAHWARSDRQAALILAMTVQQRLTTGAHLKDAVTAARGRTRRAFIKQIAADVADGAQSLGELDFGRLCRGYGLPPPTRQLVRRGPKGRIYLDAGWPEARLAVEIDGAGHRFGLAVTDDLLRQNSVLLGDELVLRVDLLGMRVAEHEFMGQVCQAFAQRKPGSGC